MPVSFSVCVFCGSATGSDPRHAAAAVAVGRELALRGWTLVYGGGSVGLMGLLADAALEAGGKVIGVIPRFLYEWEVGHDDLTDLEIVETLTERKVRMGDLADAFLTLPGGIGTMDEAFEVLSWSQLGLEQKPNGLLNVAGYYDALVAFLDRATSDGFIRQKHRELLVVGTDAGTLLDALYRSATEAAAARATPTPE